MRIDALPNGKVELRNVQTNELRSCSESLCKSFLDWLDLEVVPLGVMNAEKHEALQALRAVCQVTVSSLNATVEVMKAELGRMPSKTEVRKKLRWQGEKGLEELYPKRLHATRQELFDFLAAAETMMDRGKKSLKGHGERVFDVAFILMAMISVEVEALISAHTRQQLANELNNARVHGALLDPGLYVLLNRLSLEADLVLARRGVAFSTTRPVPRQTGKRLRHLMTVSPPDLVRSVTVFRVVAGCYPVHTIMNV